MTDNMMVRAQRAYDTVNLGPNKNWSSLDMVNAFERELKAVRDEAYSAGAKDMRERTALLASGFIYTQNLVEFIRSLPLSPPEGASVEGGSHDS